MVYLIKEVSDITVTKMSQHCSSLTSICKSVASTAVNSNLLYVLVGADEGKVFCWGWNKYGQVQWFTFSASQVSLPVKL